MQASAYLIGRTIASFIGLATPKDNSIFAGERLDGSNLKDLTFRHSTFVNISFLKVEIENCKFEDCVFIECYFRDSTLKDCTLKATRFISCDLAKIKILGPAEFTYCKFNDCFIPYNEMDVGMPTLDNVRSHLCSNMSRQAYLAGDIRDCERYRQRAAQAMERYNWKAATHGSSWFKTHFKGIRRLGAFVQFLASRFRGYLWGYQRNYLTVARNLVVLTLAVFPLLLLWARGGILPVDGSHLDYGKCILLSWQNVLPGASFFSVTYSSFFARTIVILESFVGIIMLGLVVSLIFRSVFERWISRESSQ